MLNRRNGSGACNATRGLCGGWINSRSSFATDTEYVTIATTGNATTFGDITTGTRGCKWIFLHQLVE